MSELILNNSKIKQIAYVDNDRNIFTFSGSGESLCELLKTPVELQKKLDNTTWLDSLFENLDHRFIFFNNDEFLQEALKNKNVVKWFVNNPFPENNRFKNLSSYTSIKKCFTQFYTTVTNNFTRYSSNKKTGYTDSTGGTIFTTPKGCITFYNYGRYMGERSDPYQAVIEVDGMRLSSSGNVVYPNEYVTKYDEIRFNIGITKGDAKWMSGTNYGSVSYDTYQIN